MTVTLELTLRCSIGTHFVKDVLQCLCKQFVNVGLLILAVNQVVRLRYAHGVLGYPGGVDRCTNES